MHKFFTCAPGNIECLGNKAADLTLDTYLTAPGAIVLAVLAAVVLAGVVSKYI